MIRLSAVRATIIAACLWVVVAVVGCGGDVTTPNETGRPAFHASVTFVVDSIVPTVWRVDIVVNNKDIEPVHGSFETALSDRVTMRVPPGDSLNAFARAFDGDTVILYIGEAYFDVKTTDDMDVRIPLKYKGAHAPT